jgi:prepilin-type N-terminal cleavage/methylation domain-containing protein
MERNLFVRRGGTFVKTRGVSLIELLAVLAILLILFTLAGILIGPPLKKARLAGAANSVANLAARLPIESQRQAGGQGSAIFLKATTADRTFQLVADTVDANAAAPNGPDGQYQDPTATPGDAILDPVSTVRLPEGVVFYDIGAPYDNCWTRWGDAGGGNHVLGIDLRGRTIDEAGIQITGPASVNLTHVDMTGASPTVTPLTVYRLTFNALWGVRLTRLVRDPAAVATAGWREF